MPKLRERVSCRGLMKKKKDTRGPLIGKPARTGRKKTHQNFRGHRTRTVGRLEKKLGGCAISKIEIRAVYHQILKKLSLNISGPCAEGNFGPGVSLRENYDWKRDKNSDGSVAKLLAKRMSELEGKIRGGQLPESGMFLELCYRGNDPMQFMQSTCSRCRCTYCELSPLW